MNEEPAQLRPYRAEDRDAVRELVLEVLGEFGFAGAVGGLERDLEELDARYGGRDQGFWVAVDAGRVVGTVAVRRKETGVAELKRLYLRAGQRGQGLGQRLYAHAERFAREAGYAKLWLDSSRRFRGAHRLYERNGFVLVASLDNDWEDNVYEKLLREG